MIITDIVDNFKLWWSGGPGGWGPGSHLRMGPGHMRWAQISRSWWCSEWWCLIKMFKGAPTLRPSASKKPTDARSLSPWHEVSPYHHHNNHNHHDDYQTAPPGEPNVAKWRSRWPSTRRSLSASKTSSPPLQITLPNAWSVLILRI